MDRLPGWIARFCQGVALAGLALFGLYIILRATGATAENFPQWRTLAATPPPSTASDWIAGLGIGLHFIAGTVLVLAWPILFSSTIRARHRAVHRWTGRVYVGAGLLAGVGGLSFIATHGAYARPASIAFALWGGVLVLCAGMAYLHARARRFDLHRAWAIRLFAMVLGSWVFDLEIRAWNDFTGGLGVGKGNAFGVFDHAILYLFFVPNLLVAEFFIRNGHRRLARLRWPAVTALAVAAAVFAYAVVAVTLTPGGKYGRHLLPLLAG
ncbi:DUF2306 domain-containing protein [Pseudoxanthomonas sp. 10H]|uniref:DUF2306 domain-containing protein n=1 Tax=Pseudoxanthomonas sp. 10H TaxID=3242729 RepID=UPI003557B8B8